MMKNFFVVCFEDHSDIHIQCKAVPIWVVCKLVLLKMFAIIIASNQM